MKRFFALLIVVVMLFALVACGTNFQSTDKPNSESQTADNKETKLYPLSTKESVYSTYSDIPKIIFSTTGSENGLRERFIRLAGR